MFLTWCAFWINPSERIRMGFIALLTVVATHTVISHSLPRLHYPTFCDIILTICYLFASVLIIESTWILRLEEAGEADRAQKIDLRTRRISPAAALFIIALSVLIFWL